MTPCRTRSNAPALDGLTGAFDCRPPSEGNHGPVRVRNRFHFAYADGKPYFPFGTTCYAWTHQPLDMQRRTLDTMRASGFNKLRMAVFPKHYTFNENEPLHDIYERKKDGALDFDRPNVIAFRHFETQVAALGATVIPCEGFAERGPFDVILELVGGPNMPDNLMALATGGRATGVITESQIVHHGGGEEKLLVVGVVVEAALVFGQQACEQKASDAVVGDRSARG